MTDNARHLAFRALQQVYRRGAYSDIALDRELAKVPQLERSDRALTYELVQGVVRRQRTLDAAIDRLGKKSARQQPPNLRIVLHLGLYQLRYLERVPNAAAVNTSVELAKTYGSQSLANVANGIFRHYLRLAEAGDDPLVLPETPRDRLAIAYSFPDWIVEVWLELFGLDETERLCAWFNCPPHIDLRINPLQTTLAEVEAALQAENIACDRVPHLPCALRLRGGIGKVDALPGCDRGWWTVQDSSAQLVSYLLDPQPGETLIDACAAPGGKTTHLAELMGDTGQIWACDRSASRLRKVDANAQRLQLKAIATRAVDVREAGDWVGIGDRALVDAPCSGLGTLHRRPDLRWRQTPETICELAALQGEILDRVATWVKPQGVLVYATCTLHPLENEAVIAAFCDRHPNWHIEPPALGSPPAAFSSAEGWVKIVPSRHQMDGFFTVKLRKSGH